MILAKKGPDSLKFCKNVRHQVDKYIWNRVRNYKNDDAFSLRIMEDNLS